MIAGPDDMKKLFEVELHKAERIGLFLDSTDGKDAAISTARLMMRRMLPA